MPDEELLNSAEARLNDWDGRARSWYWAYYTFGTLAVLLTITVASRPHFIQKDPECLSTLAWLAAIFQGLSTFLVALSKASAYRAAWRTLWLAKLVYLENPAEKDARKRLRDAMARGWSLIDGGYSDDSAKSRPARLSPQSHASNSKTAKRTDDGNGA